MERHIDNAHKNIEKNPKVACDENEFVENMESEKCLETNEIPEYSKKFVSNHEESVLTENVPLLEDFTCKHSNNEVQIEVIEGILEEIVEHVSSSQLNDSSNRLQDIKSIVCTNKIKPPKAVHEDFTCKLCSKVFITK